MPHPTSHVNEKFFFGEMSGPSAEKLLAGQPHGTYLFRTSSAGPTFLAVSYVKKGMVLHGKVRLSPHGTYSMDKYDEQFGTLSDLVVDWSPVLMQPLSRPSVATLPRSRRRGSRVIQTGEFSTTPRVPSTAFNTTAAVPAATERPTLMKRGSTRGGLRRSSSHGTLHGSSGSGSGSSTHTVHATPTVTPQTTSTMTQHRLPSRPPGPPVNAASRIGKLPPVRSKSRRSSLAQPVVPLAAPPTYDVAPPLTGSKLKYTSLPPETPAVRAPIQYEALP
jgi:hypothetical protein